MAQREGDCCDNSQKSFLQKTVEQTPTVIRWRALAPVIRRRLRQKSKVELQRVQHCVVGKVCMCSDHIVTDSKMPVAICLRKWILTKQRQGHIWHGHAHKCCWFKDIASPWFTVTLLFSYLRLFSFYVSLAPHMLYLYMYIHLYIVFSLLF